MEDNQIKQLIIDKFIKAINNATDHKRLNFNDDLSSEKIISYTYIKNNLSLTCIKYNEAKPISENEWETITTYHIIITDLSNNNNQLSYPISEDEFNSIYTLFIDKYTELFNKNTEDNKNQLLEKLKAL